MWVDMIAEDLLAAVIEGKDIMSNKQQSDDNIKAETLGIDQYVLTKAGSNAIYLEGMDKHFFNIKNHNIDKMLIVLNLQEKKNMNALLLSIWLGSLLCQTLVGVMRRWDSLYQSMINHML